MQDGGPSPAEHGRAEESAGRKDQLLDLPGVAGSPGPTFSKQILGPQLPRVAAWGKQDGARLAARGGAAALTA